MYAIRSYYGDPLGAIGKELNAAQDATGKSQGEEHPDHDGCAEHDNADKGGALHHLVDILAMQIENFLALGAQLLRKHFQSGLQALQSYNFV